MSDLISKEEENLKGCGEAWEYKDTPVICGETIFTREGVIICEECQWKMSEWNLSDRVYRAGTSLLVEDVKEFIKRLKIDIESKIEKLKSALIYGQNNKKHKRKNVIVEMNRTIEYITGKKDALIDLLNDKTIDKLAGSKLVEEKE